MKFWAVAALIAGLVTAVVLVFDVGFAEVFKAAGEVGWGGFALICIAGIGVEILLATAWYTLMSAHGVRWGVLLFARQLRDSVSDILPFTAVGGMVIGARAAILGGATARFAFAGMMVDVTTELVGQIAFLTLGLLVGINELRADPRLGPYASALIVSTALLVPMAAAFVVLQHRGSRFAENLAERFLPHAVSHTKAFAGALDGFYKRPLRILLSSAVHLAAWMASGAWIWLVMRQVGAPIDILSAIAIESLAGALRSATAFVPANLGVQEAGYAVLAPVFGVGPEIGLAVSLLKRARDITIGVPIVLIWQALEGKRAFTGLEPQ